MFGNPIYWLFDKSQMFVFKSIQSISANIVNWSRIFEDIIALRCDSLAHCSMALGNSRVLYARSEMSILLAVDFSGAGIASYGQFCELSWIGDATVRPTPKRTRTD